MTSTPDIERTAASPPKTWIAEFYLESSLILPEETEDIAGDATGCRIRLRNAPDGAHQNEALLADIVLTAPDIASADEKANNALRGFLDLLSFVTNSTFKISRQRMTMDWTPGVHMREQYAFGYDRYDDRFPQLVVDYLATACEIEALERVDLLRTALRWFATGVRASVALDQFQHFWFVIELIAELTKPTEQVADRCQKCRGELFCSTCNSVSKHRPFAKQAIEILFDRLSVGKDVQRALFEVRNGIMHGRQQTEIEDSLRKILPEFQIADAVDTIWQIAHSAIFDTLQIPAETIGSLTFAKPDSIASRVMKLKGHFNIALKEDHDNPKIENVVVPEITAVVYNDLGIEIDRRTGRPLSGHR